MANDLEGKVLLEYPLGLGRSATDAYGNPVQYMLFTINTDTKATKLAGDESEGGVLVSDDRVGTTGGTLSTDNQQAINSKTQDKDWTSRLDGSAAAATPLNTQRGMVKLNKIIVLPMPNEHQVNTAIDYNTDYDPNMLVKAGDMANQARGAMLSELAKLGGAALGAGGINKLKSLVTNSTSGQADTNSVLAMSRLALNPKKEVMFTGFKFRQFTFSHTFAPKSEEESNTVNEIIKSFRFYALPEISAAKMFYIFPSEFELRFMIGRKENPNIPKIATAVLQRVGVNYSPMGTGWSTLPNGSPVAIQMTLEFIELELIDRARVWATGAPLTSGF